MAIITLSDGRRILEVPSNTPGLHGAPLRAHLHAPLRVVRAVDEPPKTCATCRAVNKSSSKFCTACGASFSPPKGAARASSKRSATMRTIWDLTPEAASLLATADPAALAAMHARRGPDAIARVEARGWGRCTDDVKLAAREYAPQRYDAARASWFASGGPKSAA